MLTTKNLEFTLRKQTFLRKTKGKSTYSVFSMAFLSTYSVFLQVILSTYSVFSAAKHKLLLPLKELFSPS